jgi:hypothetical protein
MRRRVLWHSVGVGQRTRAVGQRGLVRVVAALLVLASTLVLAIRPAQAANPFVDVLPSDPAYTAIDALYNMNIIKGYPTNPPTFGPGDLSLRAQMAALIGRAMAWDTGGTNPFTDRCVGASCIDDELWGFVAALASRNVAKGYDATTFGPFDNVLKQQVILFISRAKVAKGDWAKQPDNPRLYPGSAGSTSDHQDIVTYVFYAGAPPDAPIVLDAAWGDYASQATRGWFARALWQTYPAGKGAPVTDPGPGSGWTRPAADANWLTTVNAYRTLAGLQAVTEDASQTSGCAKHANYIVKTGTLEHNEDTNSQYYTPEGLAAAKSSDLGAGSGPAPTDRAMIEGFAGSVFHALGVFAARLQTAGYAVFSDPNSNTGFTYGTCLNIITGQTGTATYPVMFPPANGVQPFLTGKIGGEYPNPISNCAGYSAPVGGVVLLQVQDTVTSSSGTLKQGGTTLESCVYDGTNYSNGDGAAQNTGRQVMGGYHAVALIPKQPLTASTTYNVSFTVNGANYAWSFTTAPTGQAVP